MNIRELEKVKRELTKELQDYRKLLASPIFKLSDRTKDLYSKRITSLQNQLNEVEKELEQKRKNRKRWG